MNNGVLRLGIDIGGTFTDFVLFDSESNKVWTDKILTTPSEPSRAVLHGLKLLLDRQRLTARQLSAIVHGTTLATNAIIQRTGARTALITTRGFRDILEIRRQKRYDVHNLGIDLPEPLVPRYLRFEVDERVGPDGTVLMPLAEADVLSLVPTLRAQDVTSVAVVLLNSFANDRHECRVEELLRTHLPEVQVSISSEVNPEIREYERTSTTVVNAYVKPLVITYLRKLQADLELLGYRGPLYIMLSGGGISSVEVAGGQPVRMIESGPAGGAVAASAFGELAGESNVIAFDMGGTTAKICLIEDGRPSPAIESEVARLRWYQRGSGYPVRSPGIEMIEIGTGGGSIARVDDTGLLKVGPNSAGADPGPACYGLGGELPTVTDADLILGYLDSDQLLGGAIRLSRSAAERAMNRLSIELGTSMLGTAWGIHHIANEQMAISARLHAIQRGSDPARYSLVAFGGAGPVHAAAIAKRLGVTRILYPPLAGVASALGMLVAPLSIELTRGYATKRENIDWSRLSRLFADMERYAFELLQQSGVSPAAIRCRRYAAVCYEGQGYELETQLPSDFVSTNNWAGLEQRFHEQYGRLYGRATPGVPIVALTWRLIADGPSSDFDAERTFGRQESGLRSSSDGVCRQAYFSELAGFVECPVYERTRLEPGETLRGPALIEEPDSTVVVHPDMDITLDTTGLLVARVLGSAVTGTRDAER